MKIGIDKIGVEFSDKYLDIKDLAIARNVDVDKFTKGIGQLEMSFTSKNQDIVTLAIKATRDILTEDDKKNIDLVIFATESSIDESKAASIYIKNYLGINDYCKCIEIKQACFGATAGLDYAKAHVAMNPNSKALVIAADIAKYGKNTGGEVTQGAGAIAMLVSTNPSIIEFNNDEIACSEDIMDFWRPTYSKYALVDGKFSVEKYLELLSKSYSGYKNLNNTDFSAICLHVPYTKMAYKGLNSITNDEKILKEFEASVEYNKRVGNIYTGSLYLSMLSLILNSKNIKAGDKIGMFSYGSGAVAEFFSVTLVKGYENSIDKEKIEIKLNNRKKYSVEEYENMFFEDINLDENGTAYLGAVDDDVYLKEILNHKRIYEVIDYVER
ncbi:hydroxymethylglutaryl-CoA synthase [Streptobacillus moniliformis]|uniref:hydroxymethylglutaryl-CoA synthase n=1 Tax=Streptobacillus moniliformis TaxID=34105 RepID=UPI0007E3AD5F|nr:hydroxymethylglutaryl-CoA synthase [Streptobacillus moniliformis]